MQALATLRGRCSPTRRAYRIADAIAALMGEWVAARNLDEDRRRIYWHGKCAGAVQRRGTDYSRKDWARHAKPAISTHAIIPDRPVLTPASPLRFSNHDGEGARGGAQLRRRCSEFGYGRGVGGEGLKNPRVGVLILRLGIIKLNNNKWLMAFRCAGHELGNWLGYHSGIIAAYFPWLYNHKELGCTILGVLCFGRIDY